MAIEGLYNKTCSWVRTTDDGTVNEYGEATLQEAILFSGVKCRLEKIYDRELVEAYVGGDTDISLYVLYLPVKAIDPDDDLVVTNIRANDIVTVAGFIPDMSPVSTEPNILTVVDVEDAAGSQNHHLEVYCKYRKVIK